MVAPMQRALRRMRPSGQAAGIDGWKGVLLRWAPFMLQVMYGEALRRASLQRQYPDEWSVNLVTHVPKPGKSVTDISKMRDLWNCAHGWKVCTQVLRQEYDRVSGFVMPGCQRGFRAYMNAGEAAGVASFQTEVATALCMPVIRLYVDLKGFFMGIQRKLLYALEGELGVATEVTQCIKTVHDVMRGRADTAHGLSEPWKVLTGTGQGCVCAPCRSTLQLIIMIMAIERYGGGYCMEVPAGASAACFRQVWFADDLSGGARDGQSLQCTFDGATIGCRLTGNEIGVDPGGGRSKSAVSVADCDQAGGYVEGEDYDIRVGMDTTVPGLAAEEEYTLLGHKVETSVGNPRTALAAEQRMVQGVRALSRVRGVSLAGFGVLCDGLVGSLARYYGGPSPIGWAAAERVDVERRKAVRRLGHGAPGGPRCQMYADNREGGMAQTHVYAHTGAASLVHVDDGLRAQRGEPFGMASQAAIALRAHQLGFVPTREARTPLDWRPTHAVRVLEAGTDAGTDAWWLALLRSGIATRHTGAGAGSGLPLDPTLRHFRPPQDGGGPVVWGLVPTELFSADLCATGWSGSEGGRGRGGAERSGVGVAPDPPPHAAPPFQAQKPRSPLAAHACGHANIDIYIFLTRHARNTSELE